MRPELFRTAIILPINEKGLRLHRIQHYKYSQEFHEICQTIFDSSPITFCSIGRLFSNGTYTGFMSDPDWTNLYLSKHYHSSLALWLEAEIEHNVPGYALWSMSSIFNQDPHLKSLQKDCADFGYYNGINIIDSYPNYLELIRFASPKKEGIDSFFLEKKEALRYNILFIKEKIQNDPCLSHEFTKQYPLPQRHPKLLTKIQKNEENRLDGISKFYIGFPIKEADFLTRREIECIIPYLLGIQTKVIANKYEMSPRTVEKHIEHIKEKTSVELSLLKPLLLSNNYIQALVPQILSSFIAANKNLSCSQLMRQS